MSDKPSAESRGPVSAEAVADYLLAHPEFFQERRKLLTRLEIPHAAGGAVSLVERQVQILRQENRHLEQRLVDWMEIARDNDRLLARLHALAVALLAVPGRSGRIRLLAERLRAEFGAAAVLLVLPGAAEAGEPDLVRRMAPDDAALEGVAELLADGRPACRPLSEQRRERLFGGDASLGSVAFVPLGATAGVLVLASADPGHFHPGLDVTYLARLGEIAAAVVGAAS